MSDLPTSTLGRTGLTVTKLGYGAMELRGGGGTGPTARPSMPPDEADRILNAVLDAGITFIDTSPDYNESEEHIGRAISHRRDEFVLASKCGCPMVIPQGAPRPVPHDYSHDNIVAAVERSLRRMRTDHLDVLQLHMSPSRDLIEREDAVATMQELRDAGKVRFIGSSSTLPNLADHLDMGVFEEFQIPYSGLEREHEELIGAAAAAGAGVVVRGGVAKGEGRGSERNPDRWERWARAGLDDLLDSASPTAFLLRFTISHPGMSTTIVGTANPEHLAENVAAARLGPLPDDIYAEAKRRLAAAGSAP
jgi:aryl-alcohol dehydrogenase-like predicted oxidoreductase